MSAYAGRRVFRAPKWYLVSVIVAASLFLFAAEAMYRMRGLVPMTFAAIAMSVIGVLGVVETLVAKVELTDDAMRVTRLWSRRSYPREHIVAVHSAKGVATKVEVEKGQFIELPPVDGSVNSVRAWIKSTG